jgi:uncharacterized protein DUF3106
MPFVFPRFFATCALALAWMPGQAAAAQPSPVGPPRPPLSSTPVDSFRQLLAAKPEERAQLLAAKRPEARRVLENSLRTYDALPPDEREARLRALELRFRLASLLRMAPSNRAERLRFVPERDRALVEERLQIWDQFSPQEQQRLLESERMIRLISGSPSPPMGSLPLSNQASNQLRAIEVQLLQWQSVPPQERVRIQRNLIRVFDLSARLSPEEREKMRLSLERFKTLSPAQREECFRNFTRFADFSPAERRQFLVEVQEWEQLKPEDRATWRKLVSRMRPLPPRREPPLPPFRTIAPRNLQVATNDNG